jgi:2-oxo-hept-3-ene-1,7-dioate hydratase
MKSMTVLSEEIATQIAQQLEKAEQSGVQIPQLRNSYPGMTIADGYAVQRAWINLKKSAGRTVRGHKIGLTSRAMQRAVNIDEPDYGVLMDDMFLEDGVKIETDRLIQPLIEAELAFKLSKDLSGPNCTIYDVLDATSYVFPALEVLDARIQRIDPTTGRTRTVVETISDNADNCAIVCGGRPVRPLDVDLRRVSSLVSRNGVIEETGVAAGVLNHPANGVAWLTKRLHRWGDGLKAGEVILSGSFIRPIPASKGDVFQADYGELGSIACHFI